jgi:hypothetical protein
MDWLCRRPRLVVTAVTRQPSGHEPWSVRWRTPQLSRTLFLWADGQSDALGIRGRALAADGRCYLALAKAKGRGVPVLTGDISQSETKAI